MKKRIGNKKSVIFASIILILVIISAGFWQYSSSPRVLAEGVVSINIGQGQSYVDQPVKIPVDRQPKDSHTRQLMQQQGIDPEYAELVQDYGKALTASEKAAKQARGDNSPSPTPYGRTYRDTKSGKYILETQGLPMVDAGGNPLIPKWEQIGQNYQAKNNLFNLQVVDTDGRIRLTAKNDQPDGRRANDVVMFKPELYLGATQQTSGSPTLLAVDPINPNYGENVLEWDYGVIKRWMRLIEGRYLGYWLRPVNLNQEMRIVYNQTGNFRLKLGRFSVGEDEEFVPALPPAILTPRINYQGREYYLISDSATFYPDANPETTSVDGRATQYNASGDTWANIRGGAGNYASDSEAYTEVVIIESHSSTDKWLGIRRGILLFDTSSLPDACVISAADLSVYGKTKLDQNSWNPDLNVYSSAPASNTSVAAGDFDSLGTTAFCDTAKSYAGFSTSGYNDFSLNASGLAAIDKAGVSKFGFRNANYDVANSAPSWAGSKTSYFTIYFAEQGTGYKPKLVVTYTASPVSNNPSSANLGAVGPNTTPSTGLYFTVTNNSGSAVNITISGTDITGGTTWTLSDTATPGPTTAGMKASLDGVSYNIIVKKTAPFNTLVSNLANGASQSWGLQLLAPTAYTDSTQKTGTVTLTATSN
ncbi:MAG: hypothetical protein A2Z02_02925 [Chloroflexi bacterium RBG_16_48_7]|nr:MAG: hypothetical protein A2Z02_02925 [Chloroflexi bacterium RBG_16_48_7]